MVFRKRGGLLPNEHWTYDGCHIEVVNNFNYLGTVFNYTVLISIICTLQAFRQTDAVMCYKCDHVAHPRDCDRVVQCSDGEVCHVVSYAQPDGHYYYVTGCKSQASCPQHWSAVGKRDIAFCSRCCDGDYCNKELCDGPPPTEHGPRCLQCSTVEDPRHCGAVTECAKGQVCYTNEKYVFGELRYQLGCADSGCTPRTYRGLFQNRVGSLKKRAGLCHSCCSGENCNRNLCLNTGSPHTQAPATVPTYVPTTQAPSQEHTTFPYNLQGCHYRGKVYHLNQTWDEGCDFRCTCIDEKSGRYSCMDICPTYLNVPSQCSMIKYPGECCAHPDCHGMHIYMTNITTTNYSSPITLNRCYYKGQEYTQDAVWRDACDYECTCVDSSQGYYRCTSLCYTWNLPAKCHLEEPAPGKCCKTPSCPAGYIINYPPGYVAN